MKIGKDSLKGLKLKLQNHKAAVYGIFEIFSKIQ